jgi:hypothetical protein
LDSAVAHEMTSLNRRLFDNAYFRSIDALVLLASYRLSTMLEWLPWLAAFCVAALMDGGVVRVLRSREFRQHDPELFAAFTCLAIVTACAAVVGFVIPVTLHPLSMPAGPRVREFPSPRLNAPHLSLGHPPEACPSWVRFPTRRLGIRRWQAPKRTATPSLHQAADKGMR